MGLFKRKNQTSLNHDEVVDIKKKVTTVAKYAHMQYLQFIAVGFSEEQALQLVTATLKTNKILKG